MTHGWSRCSAFVLPSALIHSVPQTGRAGQIAGLLAVGPRYAAAWPADETGSSSETRDVARRSAAPQHARLYWYKSANIRFKSSAGDATAAGPPP